MRWNIFEMRLNVPTGKQTELAASEPDVTDVDVVVL
jgi:hypothetical protein